MFSKSEVLIIMSDEHRYFTEEKYGRKVTDLELIEHWEKVRPKVIDGKVRPTFQLKFF